MDARPQPSGSPARALVVLTTLFFMWGFLTVMNDVLVPHWKKLFALSYFESQLVPLCFFGAYFFGSLVYYLLSRSSGDPIARMGYKRGLLLGLGLSAFGCAAFAPASLLHSYPLHLAALFVLGLGFTLLQIAANSFVAILGDPEGASSRLNMAQGFNSLGTTLAPLVGGALLFANSDPSSAVRLPYLLLAVVLLLLAVVLFLTPLPEPPVERTDARSHAWRHPQLRWGMVAIFCYVGAEVGIGTFAINFFGLPDLLGLPETTAKHYLSLYWGGAMTGRFLGAFALSTRWRWVERVGGMALVGLLMFGLLLALNSSGPLRWTHLWPFAVLVVANMAVFLVAGPRPSRALGLFALVASALLLGAIALHGAWAMWAIVAIGLFNSIMWSNIFTLAIDGLGSDTSQGSSLLVMMILGGALIPPLQGLFIDAMKERGQLTEGFHLSFALPLLCYAYLAWYGFRGSQHPARA